MISAILPSINENESPIFWDNVQLLKLSCELILVDGGSQDGTYDRFRSKGVCVYLYPGATRPQLYSYGLQRAKGDWIWLIHPQTRVTPKALLEIEKLKAEQTWGAFQSKRFKISSLFGKVSPEQCIFFSRDMISQFKSGGSPFVHKPLILPIAL